MFEAMRRWFWGYKEIPLVLGMIAVIAGLIGLAIDYPYVALGVGGSTILITLLMGLGDKPGNG